LTHADVGNAGFLHEAETLTITASSGDAATLNSDAAASGGQYLMYNSNAVGDYVRVTVPTVAAGTYNVRIGVKKYTPRATVQTVAGPVGGTLANVGPVVDLYGSSAFVELDLGTWTATTTGDKSFEFRVAGKNAGSTGYTMAIDYIKLQ
jgi:hypothetical protein